jgi:hypothetical protein
MSRVVVWFIGGLALAGHHLQAALPTDSAERASIVGKLTSLDIEPKSITLDGQRASQQVLVTGRYADGSLRDLTCFCDWVSAAPELVEVTARGLATGRHDGTTQLEIHAAGISLRVPVTIQGRGTRQPVSFRRELMPVLSTAGCSDIRCHGAPSGKNGFRLSLWGSNPDLDFQQLTRSVWGRRTNSLDPDNSLIMNKALARVSHVGGRRFAPDSPNAKLLRDWQTEGRRDDPAPIGLRSLVITPARRVLKAPARWQQLSTRATFDDGSTADVTRLTTFSSSDLAIADVDRTGLVEFKVQGEVAILCRFMGRLVSVRLMHIAEPASDYQWPDPPENNHVDTHVFAKLKMLNIAPSDLCSDEHFVRRIYLDLCGILPTPDEVRTFVATTEPDKRARLIDRLLHGREFAEFWSKKWMDVLRVSRDSIQWTGAKAYHGWLRQRIEEDDSFAEVVHAMLTSQGESFRDPAVNFYCVPQIPKKVDDAAYLQKDLAEATAQLFLGVRLQCAKCHNHPYESWTRNDYLGLAAHFTQVKRKRLGKAGPSGRAERRQIAVALDYNGPEVINESTGKSVAPQLPGQHRANIDPKQDRRQRLADWLTNRENPFFAKAIVNRVWFHLHGRGIVEPVDDFRDSNPAVNDALLDALAAEFVANNYRLKPLIRTITNSRTYQLSAIPTGSNRTDERYFSHMLARPLHAEVLLDAICDVTGVPEKFQITNDYTIGVPEGFVALPANTRAVQLPVNDIVTLINTGSKYVRYESHPFLRSFGQPTRTQTCECDREQIFSRKQALELIMGEMTSSRLARTDNRLGRMLAVTNSDREILGELYLRAFSRSPTQSAAEALLQHVANSADRRQGWEDVLWTVLNSQEFIYQH